MASARQRALLREILRLLISERSDAQLLYIPRGEAGLRRMIGELFKMRTPNENDDALFSMLEELDRLDHHP